MSTYRNDDYLIARYDNVTAVFVFRHKVVIVNANGVVTEVKRELSDDGTGRL